MAGGDHLSSPPAWPGPAVAGRRCRRGRAANPGTSRALIVPLFGLAPGGVWPPVRRRNGRALLPPDFTLAPISEMEMGRCVSAPLSVSCAGLIHCGSLGVTQHLARRSPDFPPRRGRGGHPARLASAFTVAQGVGAVNRGRVYQMVCRFRVKPGSSGSADMVVGAFSMVIGRLGR